VSRIFKSRSSLDCVRRLQDKFPKESQRRVFQHSPSVGFVLSKSKSTFIRTCRFLALGCYLLHQLASGFVVPSMPKIITCCRWSSLRDLLHIFFSTLHSQGHGFVCHVPVYCDRRFRLDRLRRWPSLSRWISMHAGCKETRTRTTSFRSLRVPDGPM
jgi:hypothetical protein